MSKQNLPIIIACVVAFLGIQIYASTQQTQRQEYAAKKAQWVRWEQSRLSIDWTKDDAKAFSKIDQAIASLERFRKDWPKAASPEVAWVGSRLASLKERRASLPQVAPVDSSSGAAAPDSQAVALAEKPEPPRSEAWRAFQARLSAQTAREWPLESPNLVATLSARGATVGELHFPAFKEPSFKSVSDHDTPMAKLEAFRPFQAFDPAVRSFSITTPAEKGLDREDWLHEDLADGGHRFRRLLGDGDLEVTKDFVPARGENDFHFVLTVSVENKGTASRPFGYRLLGSAGMVEPSTAYPQPIEATVATRDRQGGYSHEDRPGPTVVEEWKKARSSLVVQASPALGTRIAHFGLDVKSFACVVIPQDAKHPLDSVRAIPLLELAGRAPTAAEERAHAAGEVSPAGQIVVEGALSEFQVLPGPDNKVSQSYVVFCGPRWRARILDNPIYEKAGLENLVAFKSSVPGAGFVAKSLTMVLLGFHWLTGSWGISIVLLTLVVRAFLHPLMVKQTKSSLKMQALAPESAKLKAKYEGKDGQMSPENAKKFQAEQWDLYKKHGVNPLGCMGPMLLQFPIFIGLWYALNYAFELRQVPFLWIRDLSEPDTIARLPFSLPFLGTNAFCILPILMFIVYMVQMRSMPKPTDPQAAEQQKIMNWMMPLFGYMFYRVPSGLLLYYITSSTLGMIEQRWIKKRLGIAPAGGAVPASAVPASP